MKKTRNNVFETNSSSTHSICIAKNATYDLPESIHFAFGGFGWEVDTLTSNAEKASYLYTAIVNYGYSITMEDIVERLKSHGVEVTLEEQGKPGSYDDGYIDHGSELSDFMGTISISDDSLLSFLFSGLSFIRTSNDNGGPDVDINVSYPHDAYYKGN